MTRSPFILTFILLLALAPPVGAQDQTSHGYVRTLEGSAVLTRADTGDRIELVPNYPVEAGDSLATDPLTRIELVLPDFTVLRLDADTRVVLARLAFSADSDDRVTVLELEGGELQLEVTEHALGDELPTIHTPNATVYVLEPGSYRIGASPMGETRLVVRQGYAEASTTRGSAIGRSGEEIVVTGTDWPTVSVLEASYPDDLELWGEELASRVESARYVDEVDPALGYSTAPLEEHGEWISVEGETAWRPAVEVSWRPFSRGSWAHSRIGLTWVSHEPWGWVTAHYGYWSLHPTWGWVWYPGAVYSPAWVYWYWGPEWVGWVPAGYYGAPYYSPFYGYAGGYWSYYSHWTFCPSVYIVHPHGHRHYHRGHEMERTTGRPAVPRGLITTHTGGIDRPVWRDGARVADVLERRAVDTRGGTPPDVTDFVAGRDGPPPEAVDSRAIDRARLDRNETDRVRTDRRPSDRDVVADGRGRSTSDLGASTDRRGAVDRVDTQGWRQDGRDRVVLVRPHAADRRGDRSADAARSGTTRSEAGRADTASRLRQAWRSRYESSDRYRVWQGHSGDRGYRSDDADSPDRSYRGRSDRDLGRQSVPPARRVIDGIRTRPDDRSRDDSSTSRRERGRSDRATPPTRSSRDRSSTSSRSRSDGRRPSASSHDRSRDRGARSRGSASRRSDHGGSSRSRRSDGGGSRDRGGSRGGSDHDG